MAYVRYDLPKDRARVHACFGFLGLYVRPFCGPFDQSFGVLSVCERPSFGFEFLGLCVRAFFGVLGLEVAQCLFFFV